MQRWKIHMRSSFGRQSILATTWQGGLTASVDGNCMRTTSFAGGPNSGCGFTGSVMALLLLALFERAMQNWLTELFVASERLRDFPLNVVLLKAIKRYTQTQTWPPLHSRKASFRLCPLPSRKVGKNCRNKSVGTTFTKITKKKVWWDLP